MLKKKYIILIFLACCLTATLLVGVTSSAEYDPWYDVNSDGEIDIVDLVNEAIRFGTEGNPTRNVTVTNFPLDEEGNMKVTIAQEPLRTYKDAIEITALDWTATDYSDSREYGTIIIHENLTYPFRETKLELPFAFSPEQGFLNVTGLWISIVASSMAGDGSYKFNITVNDILSFEPSSIYYPNEPWLTVHSIHITSESIYPLVVEGINKITLSDPIYWAHGGWHWGQLQIYRVTVFIEYEYLA